MYQLGNLAVLCAKKRDVSMQIFDGTVSVHVGYGPQRTSFRAAYNNNAQIEKIIYELNFGRFKNTGYIPASERAKRIKEMYKPGERVLLISMHEELRCRKVLRVKSLALTALGKSW